MKILFLIFEGGGGGQKRKCLLAIAVQKNYSYQRSLVHLLDQMDYLVNTYILFCAPLSTIVINFFRKNCVILFNFHLTFWATKDYHLICVIFEIKILEIFFFNYVLNGTGWGRGAWQSIPKIIKLTYLCCLFNFQKILQIRFLYSYQKKCRIF